VSADATHTPAPAESSASALMGKPEAITPVVAVEHRGHLLVLDQCCYCGARHTHGDGGQPGPWHRVAHCPTPQPKGASAGYVLVERETIIPRPDT
jgi:hypothetical protein